jgi:hypothetical protein
MVFGPPEWVPPLPPIPDSVPICDFLLDEKNGRREDSSSYAPLTCAISGKEYSVADVRHRVEQVAKALATKLKWEVDGGTQWEKVVGIFAFNSVSTQTPTNF